MKRRIILLFALITALSLAACSPDTQKNQTVIRVGFFPNITHSQALLGQADGRFEKALGSGFKIKWIKFGAGPEEMEAFFAGEVDIGYIGPGPAINGYIKSDGDVRIIAGAADAGAVLVTRKGLNINKVSQLSGKRVAVPQYGNTQDLILRDILKQNGLKDKLKGGTVEIRQVSNSDLETLFLNGEIDAAVVPEPWGTILEKEAQADLLLDNKQLWRDGAYSSAIVIARTEFIKTNPGVIERFVAGHIDETQYINRNPVEAKKTVNSQIAKLTKKSIPENILDAAFDRQTVTYDPQTDSVKAFYSLMVDNGIVSDKKGIDDIFDLNYLEKALKNK